MAQQDPHNYSDPIKREKSNEIWIIKWMGEGERRGILSCSVWRER
jgi:hypothetical protein